MCVTLKSTQLCFKLLKNFHLSYAIKFYCVFGFIFIWSCQIQNYLNYYQNIPNNTNNNNGSESTITTTTTTTTTEVLPKLPASKASSRSAASSNFPPVKQASASPRGTLSPQSKPSSGRGRLFGCYWAFYYCWVCCQMWRLLFNTHPNEPWNVYQT